jgi:hypothetical protein
MEGVMTIDYLFPGAANAVAVRKTLIESLAVLALLASSQMASAQTVLPADVDPKSCTVAPDDFKAWFANNAVSKDGIVLPADSLTFSSPPPPTSLSASLCPFFTWSEQMFLWLTSPLGAGHVFETSQFFEVSPPDPATGNRTLHAPGTPGQFFSFAPSIALAGDKGQEVAFDSTGKVHDVVRPATGPAGRLALLNAANQLTEVGRVLAAPDGKPLLLDKSNKAIDLKAASNGSPLLLNESGPLRSTTGAVINLAPETVLVNGKPTLLTTSGGVVETEQGQALDSAVLMAQNKSLVYYLLQVNDVFAYFKTGAADTKITPAPTQFPTAQDMLDKITAVATQAPPPFTKPQFPKKGIALTMEIKSAWVETTGLANVNDYITIKTTIPTYTQTPTIWTPSGSRQATLALVGMHVVGSANGHPEMIWATFEHVNNTPNTQYTYNAASGPITKPADGAGSWLFSASGAAPAQPPQTMTVGPKNTIVAATNKTIAPVDVSRINPWGTAATDAQAAEANTAVISINKSITDQLAAGDVRKNYLMIGSIWTNGQPPASNNRLGTTAVANSTMETFKQPGSCFNCHSGNMLGISTGGLSHIWGKITPLFPP